MRAEGEENSVVICGRGRGGSQACPKERKLRGPQFRSFSSSYPILFLSRSLFLGLHLQRKCSYERLISSRVYYDGRLVARSPGRGCVRVRTRMHARVARPQKRHTPLPLLGHLPSPSQSCGTRGRFVREHRTRPMLRTETLCDDLGQASKGIFKISRVLIERQSIQWRQLMSRSLDTWPFYDSIVNKIA